MNIKRTFLLLAAMACINAFAPASHAIDYTFVPGGVNDWWGTAANWSPVGIPNSVNDRVIFDAFALPNYSTNTHPGPPFTVREMIFNTPSNWRIHNNERDVNFDAPGVSDAYITQNGTGVVTFDADWVLTDNTVVRGTGSGDINLNGSIQNNPVQRRGIIGPGRLTKEGSFTLTINPTIQNTGGTVINDGIVRYNKSGLGLGPALGQFGSPHTTTINSGGTLQLTNNWVMGQGLLNQINVNGGTLAFLNSDNYQGNITLDEGTITTSGGTRPWRTGNWGSGLITVNNTGAGSSNINGTLFFVGTGAAPITTFDVADGTAANDLVMNAAIHDHPGAFIGQMQLVKSGDGTMLLNGNSTFSGGTVLSQGTLATTSNSPANPFGTGTITINDGATGTSDTSLFGRGGDTVINNNIVITNNGTGTTTIGTDAGGRTIYTGTININKDVTFRGSATDRTTYLGAISGTGNILVNGGDRTTWQGNNNTFVGNVDIQGAGTVLQVGNPGGGNEIPDASNVNVGAGSRFHLVFVNETINGLTGNGTVAFFPGGSLGATTLTVGAGNANATFDGLITNGSGSPFGLAKTGTGTQILTNSNNYTGGTVVSQGTLQLGNGGASGSIVGTVTLGDANTGANDVAFLVNRSDVNTHANNIVVSALGTGTATIGSNSVVAGPQATVFTGTINLNRPTTMQGTDPDRTTYTNVISGNVGTLTVNGGRRTTWEANNTFVGDVVLSGAGTILQVGSGSAATTEQIPNASDVNVGAGTTLRLVFDDETINGLNGSGTVTSILGSRVLTVGAGNGNGNFSGSILNGSGMRLVKTGDGTQILAGNNNIGNSIYVQRGTGVSTLVFDGGGTTTTNFVGVGNPLNIGGQTGTAIVEVNNHTLDVNGNLYLGERYGHAGNVDQTAGVVDVSGQVRIGHWPNETSTYDMTGGTIVNTGGLYVGWDGNGALDVSGTSDVTTNDLIIQRFSTATFRENSTLNAAVVRVGDERQNGTLNIQDNATVNIGLFTIGDSANDSGIVNQSGGTTTVTGSFLLGHWSNETSQYNMSGGTLAVNGASNAQEGAGTLTVGIDGTGDFNQTGGAITAHRVHLNSRNNGLGGTSTYDLTGGTLDIGAGGLTGNVSGASNFVFTLGGTGVLDLQDNNINLPESATRFNFVGGTLQDVNQFEGTLNQDGGLLRIGAENPTFATRDIMTVTGDYNQNAGVLEIDIFGPGSHGFNGESGSGLAIDPLSPDLDSDLLHALGNATLAGTLDINLNGFEPGPFHWYDVLLADDTITVDESTFQLTGVNLFRVIDNPFGPGQLLQVAVPEPASVAIWSLIGLALAGFTWWRRNKSV